MKEEEVLPSKTIFNKNPELAMVNMNAPVAPKGNRRFLDYFNELKEDDNHNNSHEVNK